LFVGRSIVHDDTLSPLQLYSYHQSQIGGLENHGWHIEMERCGDWSFRKAERHTKLGMRAVERYESSTETAVTSILSRNDGMQRSSSTRIRPWSCAIAIILVLQHTTFLQISTRVISVTASNKVRIGPHHGVAMPFIHCHLFSPTRLFRTYAAGGGSINDVDHCAMPIRWDTCVSLTTMERWRTSSSSAMTLLVLISAAVVVLLWWARRETRIPSRSCHARKKIR
jgi:hypothetical protein